MNSLETFVIAGVLGLPLLVALFAFRWWMGQASADNAVRRMRAATRFHADALGNYEAFYNPKTGASFVLPPGNSAHPVQIILSNGQTKPLENINTRPFVVQVNSGFKLPPAQPEQKPIEDVSTGDFKELEPEQVETQAEVKQLPEPEQVRTVEQVIALLAEMKQSRGEGSKVKSILEAAQIKSRSSETYKIYSAIWDGL
jgi:hypothetical protein